MNRKLKRTALITSQHIGIISEGLCDTEINDIKKTLQIYTHTLHTLYLYIYIDYRYSI